jgi:hypothetical protein
MNLGFLMVKMATPNGTINHLRERIKTIGGSWGSRSQVGKMRCVTLSNRVGQGVIALRYSEKHSMEKSMIRHSSNASEFWKNLNWKKFHKDLFRLQKRVFKAVQAGDKRKARSLQKLILKSQAARFLAIRQVSQLNAGKKTAGIDGQKSLDFQERLDLEATLKK